jgi:hypothetical protein
MESIAAGCLLALQLPVFAQDAAPAGEMVVIDLRPKEEREGTGSSS